MTFTTDQWRRLKREVIGLAFLCLFFGVSLGVALALLVTRR